MGRTGRELGRSRGIRGFAGSRYAPRVKPAHSTRAAALVTAALLAALACVAPPLAHAQERRAAVGAIDGPRARALRAALEDELRGDARLETSSAAFGGRGPELVITARVGGARRRVRFELRALDGYDNVLATRSGAFTRGSAGDRPIIEALRSLIDEALTRLPPPAPLAPSAPEPPDEPPAEPPMEPGEPEASRDDPRLFTALVGVVARNRSASVELRNGGAHAYESGVYAELGLALELRPLAHEEGLVRGLFARASYHHAVGLGSEQCDTVTCTSFDTTFFRFAADAGFLFALADVLELGPSLGGGFEAYQLGDNPVLPTAEYPYLRVGLRARALALGELLVFDGDLGYRGLLGRDRLGSAFGPSGESFAMDASVGVSSTLDLGLALRIELGWAAAWHAFEGSGALQQGRAGRDEGVRFGASVGYALP